MRSIFAALVIAALAVVAPAQAEVAAASPGGFLLQAEAELTASPEQTWRALGQLGRWWSDAHTYSGDAGHMQVDLRAGGCWCERWDGGNSVQHGRVLLVSQRDEVRTLRFDAPLGPLQEMAVTAVLTFTVAPHANGATLAMSYRVSGDPGLNLDQAAPLVDMVLMEQFGRLSRYSATGSPDQ